MPVRFQTDSPSRTLKIIRTRVLSCDSSVIFGKSASFCTGSYVARNRNDVPYAIQVDDCGGSAFLCTGLQRNGTVPTSVAFRSGLAP